MRDLDRPFLVPFGSAKIGLDPVLSSTGTGSTFGLTGLRLLSPVSHFLSQLALAFGSDRLGLGLGAKHEPRSDLG
jgi:hypothetical protein